MQSSTAVACRVLVMLGCLIVVPLVAIFGSSLPDAARALFGGRRAPGSPTSRQPLAAAPSSNTASEMVGDLPSPLGTSPKAAAAARPARPGSATPAGAIRAGLEAPLSSARPDAALPFVGLGGRSGLAQMSPAASLPARGAASSSGDFRSAPAPADREAAAIQERLRQLGATHQLLERWGSQGQLFRFHCKAAIGGNPNWNRYFEATDPDPLRAMGRVLGDVEAWRARHG